MLCLLFENKSQNGTFYQGSLLIYIAIYLIIGVPFWVHSQTLERYTFQAPHMGTTFRIVLYASSPSKAVDAARAAFKEVEQVNLIFSDYQADSEISKLVRYSQPNISVAISDPLWEVWRYAHALSHQTDGAFDVTVGHLSKLWRKAFRRLQFPEENDLNEALEKTGYQRVKIIDRPRSVQFSTADVRLDFGAIAKGFALDQMARSLRKDRIFSFLIDGGGDLYVNDSPPGEKGWEVAFPSGKKQRLSNCAIATSGDQFKYLEWEGNKYSHIIDPKTGLGITNPNTVTVVAQSGMVADAWASAASVLGKRVGRRLAKEELDIIDLYFYQN